MKLSTTGRQYGFTLIEILVVLMLTSIALLALGTFSLSVMDSGTVSRERLTAVHLGEQVIEEWQRNINDQLPDINLDCSMDASVASITMVKGTTVTQTCGLTSGNSTVDFTVEASVADANAPLPSNLNALQSMSGTVAFPNIPMVKLIVVRWDHKGVGKSIYLTHLTRGGQ
ncbi:MAG: prepilin-type cleavage/methylation domain-containing protein [Zetaproteobacteria bacterium CG06_land_8_20_14_3_00_59_53]|nr:MAG: hypothetical protein AUK36_06290 [Zetaproteobacteria bacterium CG2_30_59_37]PIO90654.1 MAG: prepilin-type cleavage/methylation domain-containing protein [Zetaproteobacteria bacterium CG23_combo_of_CG06-09_8_20_14_all_59_86]PIQ66083.1 MAG: prepilin-type cleavage/methylation domain-containing protein [Zetaproteobacteria bacterium CG11_big_fil_rev_8_21_14_0_20_59_439]PIU71600.1 MAG: prepilin-type cleavage/methylation domain-containing protein [Zetaproteobacteria bacterium CG06_land_8_20_14_